MDRRRFLQGGALAGLGAVIGGRTAAALSVVECEPDSTVSACRRLNDHDEALRSLDQMLVAKGIADPAERRAILAAAACPVCGLPLVGAAPGGF